MHEKIVETRKSPQHYYQECLMFGSRQLASSVETETVVHIPVQQAQQQPVLLAGELHIEREVGQTSLCF